LILKHEEENILQSGLIICRYLIKFKNYPHEDAKWMQEPQFKDSLSLLEEYKFLHGLDQV
ncbi:hypothetical protein, partial [Escherichia coli]|uniref:hypothetical protein n=1 Tax=Escherichia coli TaxID=562 RepID=UPI001AD93DFF